jgi:SnoaL-like domain
VWNDSPVDAITRYCEASEIVDIDGMVETLSPDVELVSPISGRMVFRGPDDVRVLLAAVYGSLRGLRWRERIADGRAVVVMGDCRIGPLTLTDAMVFDLAEDGQIRRIRPHLRPWLALTLFALIVGPKVARRPDVVRRALSQSSARQAPSTRSAIRATE